MAYNLANLLRQLAPPRPERTWTLTTLREKLIKIGAKVVSRAKAVTFQMAEVEIPHEMFAAILGRIGRLRAAPSPGRWFVAGGWEWHRAKGDGDCPP